MDGYLRFNEENRRYVFMLKNKIYIQWKIIAYPFSHFHSQATLEILFLINTILNTQHISSLLCIINYTKLLINGFAFRNRIN